MIHLVKFIGAAALSMAAFLTSALADAAPFDGTAIDVPEPASLSILVVAAGTLALLRRRR